MERRAFQGVEIVKVKVSCRIRDSAIKQPARRPGARAFAEENGIKAVNGEEFITMFQQLHSEDRSNILAAVMAGDYMTPSCPTCDVKLVLREAANCHPPFWGCRNIPRCRVVIHPRASA